MVGDCVESMRLLPDESIQCCVTSPPYFGLRDYGQAGQMGLEATPDAYVAGMVAVFREVWRVLRDDGVLWLNLGDTYTSDTKGSGGRSKMQLGNVGSFYNATRRIDHGLKPKNLIGIPWRVAFALRADGWYLRQDIIWHKPNPMPESVTDRCTKAHEYIFLLSKSARYYFDSAAIQEPFATDPAENYPARAQITGRGRQAAANARGDDRDKIGGFPPRTYKGSTFTNGKTGAVHPTVGQGERIEATGRNKRSVWTVTTKPFKGAHFATFPPDLIEPCVLAGSRPGGTVLDPFGGSGTVAGVALKHGRNAILCELNPEYVALMPARVEQICNRP
jgi:DNA modification methylase